MLCKLGIHEWGEWQESCLNRHKWRKEIVIERNCRRCGKTDMVFFKKSDLEILKTVHNPYLTDPESSNSINSMNKEWEKLKKNTANRNMAIYKTYRSGKKTMGELGKCYGISRARVSIIISTLEKKLSTESFVNSVDKKREQVYTRGR